MTNKISTLNLHVFVVSFSPKPLGKETTKPPNQGFVLELLQKIIPKKAYYTQKG